MREVTDLQIRKQRREEMVREVHRNRLAKVLRGLRKRCGKAKTSSASRKPKKAPAAKEITSGDDTKMQDTKLWGGDKLSYRKTKVGYGVETSRIAELTGDAA